MMTSKKTSKARRGYAIVGNDGVRHVVFGIGTTPAAAWKDALAQNDAEMFDGNEQAIEVTAARMQAIKAGDVDADDLIRATSARRNPRRSSEGRSVTFTLSKRETKMYDAGDARTWHEYRRSTIMPRVRAELEKGRSVEIETTDGVTIDAFNPSDHDPTSTLRNPSRGPKSYVLTTESGQDVLVSGATESDAEKRWDRSVADGDAEPRIRGTTRRATRSDERYLADRGHDYR